MNLIVFDIDGTVTDSVEAHHQAFKESLCAIGMKKSTREFKTFKHYTDTFIAKEIYEAETQSEFTAEKFIQFELELTRRLCGMNHLEIKGAKSLIEKLSSQPDFGFCFATGSLRRAAECKLKSANIPFQEWQLVAADNILERENIVSQAIKNAKLHYKQTHFERIIALGDGLWDLQTAKNLGLEFIGVGETNKSTLVENGAEFIVNDLTQVSF